MTSCSRSMITTQVGAPGLLSLAHNVKQGAAPQCQAGRTTWQYDKHLLNDHCPCRLIQLASGPICDVCWVLGRVLGSRRVTWHWSSYLAIKHQLHTHNLTSPPVSSAAELREMKQGPRADKGKASSSSSSNSTAEKTTELAAELTEVVLQLQQYKARNADVSGACLMCLPWASGVCLPCTRSGTRRAARVSGAWLCRGLSAS